MTIPNLLHDHSRLLPSTTGLRTVPPFPGLNKDTLRFIINHVILPPRVPQQEENDLRSKNFELLEFLAGVAGEYISYSSNSPASIKAKKILELTARIHEPAADFPQRLRDTILHLEEGDIFALHVFKQNAGIIFRRHEDSLQVEVFEASPVPEAILGCKGRLKCKFPGPATAIPWEVAKDPAFLRELGSFLHHMNVQQTETLSKSREGGNDLSETRDVADPRYIIELFTGMMRGIGKEFAAQSIWKSLRDEANCKSALDPWRRSGLWLVVRVALQIALGYDEYKCFLLETVRVILDQASRLEIDSYSLSCTSRKLACRASKIGETKLPLTMLERTSSTARKAFDVLSSRWQVEISGSKRMVEWEFDLNTAANITENTRLHLRNTSAWVEERIKAYRSPSVIIPVVNDPREKQRHIALDSPPKLPKGTETEAAISLIDFENWIKENLENWCSSVSMDDQADVISFLSTNIRQYHMKASQAYVNHNILDTSRMILTIMEMWVWLDKIIGGKEPLLLHYSPELPSELLEPVLFIQKEDMERLLRIEDYLQYRHSTAKESNRSSVFGRQISATNFAVHYYNQSIDLQTLRSEIIRRAEAAREEKKRERERLNEQYEQLRRDAQGLSCDYRINQKGDSYHWSPCRKCNLENQAASMRIKVNEWPLPIDENEIKVVVFELQPPEHFVTWRDVTYYIMLDVCKSVDNESPLAANFYGFNNWDILASVKSHSCGRVTWASKANPICSEIRIPADESRVLVEHAGRYLPLDAEKEEWIESRHKTHSLVPLCESDLSKTPYEALSYAVNHTSHTHNTVIAEQHKCPASLTLHEYEAFASLRSGDRIQWHNILTELQKDDLAFKDESVFTLVLHAACHAGVATDGSDWRRDSHLTLSEEELSRELLKSLRQELSVLKDNWEQANRLKLFILLARRLVTAGHCSVKLDVVGFLKEARKVCDPWIKSIQSKLEAAFEPDLVKTLWYWLLKISGIQCSTFDVDQDLLSHMFSLPEDVVQFLVCQITVHDNCFGIFSKLPQDLSFLLEANRRFAITAEGYVHECIRQDPRILFSVLKAVFPAQKLFGTWRQLSQPADRWWKLSSDGCDGSETMVVHLNILQGKLLVNGKPNGRLPEGYFTHGSYVKLFGNRIFDVFPSKMPNMSYQTKNKFYGAILHFHLEGGNMVIRKQNGEDYEFIPSEKFLGEIPSPLVRGGSQWLNLNREEVIFYQSDRWWIESPSAGDWVLSRNDGFWAMERGFDKLLDIGGNIHAMAHRTLQPIEAHDYLVSTTNQDTRIFVDLPRYKLKFFLNKSNLFECETLKGWVVDCCQDLGTFIGLKNFLKLRSRNDHLNKECALVPFGSIKSKLSETGNHCVIEIHHTDDERNYTIYHIDRFLNQVRDDGTPRARYTRIYLHALTSGIIEDPLTGRTGVGESLDLLKNAASFCFRELHNDEACILNQIASLTPSRHFYSSRSRKIQTVGWNGCIPTWVQHDEFYAAVGDIFDDWTRRQFLIERSQGHDVVEMGSNDLLERGRNISSNFSPGDPRASNRNSMAISQSLRNTVGDREASTQDIARASFKWQEKQDLDANFDSLMEKPMLTGCLSDFALEYSSGWAGRAPSDLWCTLYELCRKATKGNRFGLLFVFSFFVYDNPANRQFLKSLLVVATNTVFSDLPIPPYRSFEPNMGTKPDIADIKDFLQSSSLSYEQSQYDSWSRQSCETEAEWRRRRHSAYENDLRHQVEHAAQEILDQWPNQSVIYPPYGDYPLLKLSSAMDNITGRFQTCFRNLELSNHLTEVTARLQHLKGDVAVLRPFGYSAVTCLQEHADQSSQPREHTPTLRELLKERSVPGSLEIETTRPYSLIHDEIEMDDNLSIRRLVSLANYLENSDQKFTKQYANDLLESIKALRNSGLARGLKEIPVTLVELQTHQRLAAANVEKLMSDISRILSPNTKVQWLQKKSGLWPDITKLQLLRRLRLAERWELPREWVRAIIALGEAITWEQRASRLVGLACRGFVQEFEREVRNAGRQNWNSEEYIDWLLLELDSEMLIRPVQASIGFSMMDDSKSNNAVMQLNMGEGKSAVIVPAVAAALADTKKLVRSIVPKPLSDEMFEILVRRLGGLCDRRVYYLPFWRNMDLSKERIETIRNFYEDCMKSGAIILTLPEHILSFKLMGVEKIIQEQQEISEPLVACQEWLSKNSRDILDECDEILHIKYQLLYTMGSQLTLEGGRDRWAIIQELLGLVQEKAIEFSERDPMGLEVGPAKGVRYRPIRVIDTVTGDQMLQEVALDICTNDGKVPGILSKLKFLRLKEKKLALKFISVKNISIEEQNTLFDVCGSLKIPLLLLRGLIAGGVLLFILRDKRYRVNYGLDRRRSGLAVPFRAKDRPAIRAEFGHPEVILTLTCLTYYYSGLRKEDLQTCFDLLSKTDNPGLIYEYWIRCYSDISPNLSKLRGINFLDKEQFENDVFPVFRYNKSVIDFFLSEFIFPREAKNFAHKLSTNAWDLAEQKSHNTTGFSGTNDNKYLLPTTIQQSNLPQQIHTNSLILKNILLTENTVIKAHKNNIRLEANDLLALVADLAPKVHVLLDVSAQIIEFDNRQVAKTWLKIDPSSEVRGAVFFEDDRLLVMKRDGRVEPLVSSELSTQLDCVLVFLDEAHTRGVDLRLPVGSRAAVTLGPNLVKDKLVQGCMRMRKLGNGHSIVFLAPPDTYTGVQKSAKKQPDEPINTFDVLHWTMLESCRQIQDGFSIWADQGFQYLTKKGGWERYRENGRKDQLRENIIEKEARPLIDMYGIGSLVNRFSQGLTPPDNSEAIFQRLDQFGASPSHHISVQEEQEREVDQEQEVEVTIERPGPARPRQHSLHPAVVSLAASGIFNKSSDAFSLAYNQYERTSARSLLEREAWTPNLFATVDFMNTVELENSGRMGDYLRPVRWILSTRDRSNLILLSPYEANQLVPLIRKTKSCTLHCYAPRVAKAMPTFEFLDFCPIPSLPKAPLYRRPSLNIRIALNTFAGQLFFQDDQYYLEFCKHLGVYYGEIGSNLERNIDGWVSQKTRQALNFEKEGEDSISKFSRSPLPFLIEIIKMRRKGQEFLLTHLGAVLDARVLGANDF
ncbi:hypothetical protein TWF730_002651 [Orbilia blumenaviensis]|uniref:ubiquitinyl hydrolase 1 n=1 Tax=Orbilia blumenaviensis TaxID=1796055 RepID=A0AAV9UEY8_9PEZI